MLEDGDVANTMPVPATASEDDRAVADSVSSGPSGKLSFLQHQCSSRLGYLNRNVNTPRPPEADVTLASTHNSR